MKRPASFQLKSFGQTHAYRALVTVFALVALLCRRTSAEDPVRLPVVSTQNEIRLRPSAEKSAVAREALPEPANAYQIKSDLRGAGVRQAQSPPEAIESTHSMSLEDLTQIALGNNPTLVQASAEVEAARGNWLQVGLYPNPNIAYLGNQIGDQSTAGQQGAYIEQEFVRGRKLPLNRAVAQREIAIAQRNFDAQRMRVVNDVRIQFYNVLIAQRTLEISQTLLQISDKAYNAASELLKAGEVSRVDTLQAQVEVNTVRIGLVNAQNQHIAAWRKLASVTGVPAMDIPQLDGDVAADAPEFHWQSSVERLLSESPEIASSRIAVDRAVWALRRARAEPIPNVTIQAGPQYDLGANQTITNVNVALPIPLFNYNQGNIHKAEADVRSARAEVARKELELTTRLAAAFEKYAIARNQVQQYQQSILPQANESLELVADGYRQGEIDFITLLTAQRTCFSASLAYLNAQRDLYESTVLIDGLLLADSLQAGGDLRIDPASSGQMAVPDRAFMGK